MWLQCRRPGFDPWVRKDPLEKEMATHSSIPAWGTPWTEEPGRLQSMGGKELDMTEWLTLSLLSVSTFPSWITVLSQGGDLHNSMKLWAMACMATREGGVRVESSDKPWSTGRGNGNLLKYSCLESPMDSMRKQKHIPTEYEPTPTQVRRCPVYYLERVEGNYY